MVNNRGYIIHKTKHRKDVGMTIYSIYKENNPVNPNQVAVNVFDLGYLGVEKDYSEQLSALPYKKKEDKQGFQEEKNHNKIHSTKKENSDRACDRLPEIVLDNE